MNPDILKQLAPNPGRLPLLPKLSPQAELALLCRVLFREGYDDHIAGHISFRQPDGNFLINPWELAWDELTAADIITVDPSGAVVSGEWNVTPAISLHLAIHALRPEVDVILHNHSRFGTLWANRGEAPPIYDQTSAQVDGPIALLSEYDGTVDQADQASSAARALGDAKWALLANHGVLVVAADIRQAHLRAITLEWRCRQAWYLDAAGAGTPMPPDIAAQTGALIDGNGFPFLWEAMARRELRAEPAIDNLPY
jgi:ribulose-5-phosphate 4-epimerase/fuculose-1-phosphate aldolase